MSLNFSSSQLAQILLAGFVFKVISISLDFACELGPGPSVGWGGGELGRGWGGGGWLFSQGCLPTPDPPPNRVCVGLRITP